jgi:DNA-binding PadR family transcriptional regulator
MKKIREESGWKTSAGSMYPLLDNLLREKLVRVKKEGRRKIYSLTEKGKELLEEMIQKKTQLVDKLIKGCRVFECIVDKKSAAFLLEIFNKIKQGEIPFKELNPELMEFRNTILHLYKNNKLSKHKREIKEILKGTVKKLGRLK